MYQTDGIHNGVLFEFKKNLTNQTVYRAFGESLSYLRKFNNDGLKKIPRWICIATFDSKKYWLIDANNFKEFIYDQKYEDLYNIPSNSPHTFTLEPAGIWLDPDDLLEKVKPREGEEKYLKTRLNLHNFSKINDYFYKNNDLTNDEPSVFIKELVKGIDIQECLLNSGYDKNDKDYEIKINNLKISLEKLNNSKKIIDWVEPVFITDMQEIIAKKWDHVGGELSRKKRGAFFTPPEYCKKMQHYLLNCINECKNNLVPYLIIDRCAGSGNLEKGLPDDVLKNVILNTYEFCEWVHLGYNFNSKVKCIRPPYISARLSDVYIDENLMQSGDALTKEFNLWLDNEIKEWRNQNPNGKIIFYENPPFRDATANSHGKGESVKQNFVIEKALEEGFTRQQIRDISTQFIYSANSLMKNGDEYCLISPIKYWKWNYINFEFVEGFISNRKHYNATTGGLPIIRWRKGTNMTSIIKLENAILKQIKNRVSEFSIEEDDYEDNVYAKLFIGNMAVHNGNILTNFETERYSNKAFKVSNKNIQKISVLNCLNSWSSQNYIIDPLTIMKSADKQHQAWEDKLFLNDCLFWTLYTNKNYCVSNSDVINEICPEGLAFKKLNLYFCQGDEYKRIFKIWENIMNSTRNSKMYKPRYKYGLNQIMKEINIKVFSYKDKFGKDHYKFFDDGDLNGLIIALKEELKIFYNEKILPKLFEYELLK
ncbi:hypothetical protein NPA07_01600 [Mycoplasmopsis caviae]|uniref:Uncharacterized protein n=1 Tax=Mycoplasmopsis caviae TaxID=55603 RepID=A0ABY5J0Z2_9BACT|nr:hypothetical protein [Mycoplasmopsis caviae]UUD35549.1 hypothetical protein NPA07_01600 [Mycoplasmopsis caviae]